MIGYYPIKESEIKEIIKMIYAYKKSDEAAVDEIIDKHNLNETRKEVILKSLEKCVNSKKSKYFDVLFGVPIIEIQKMYRDYVSIEDKSLTELIRTNPILEKYTRKMQDFIKFKNNKYEFSNYLNFPESSGVYMSYNNIQELNIDYYDDADVKRCIDNYYGDFSNKFMEIIEFCSDNRCGLLEGKLEEIQKEDVSVLVDNRKVSKEKKVVETKKVDNKKNNKKKIEQSTTNSQAKKQEKILIGSGKALISIILYFILFSILFGFIYELVYEAITLNIFSVLIKIVIYSVLLSITALGIWNISIRNVFRNKKLKPNCFKKLMVGLTVFIILVCSVHATTNYFLMNYKLDKKLNSNEEIKYTESLVEKYYSNERKTKYYEDKDKKIKEAKQEAIKYFIISEAIVSTIYIIMLPYASMRIKRYNKE